MPAWGAEGGGPLTTQQIDELIAYLQSIQITSEQAQAEVEVALRKELALGEGEAIDYASPAVGEALFNLGIESGDAGAGYSCARCHTKGSSFLYGAVDPVDADLSDYAGYPDGSGAFGWALTSGVVPRQFLTVEALVEFLYEGTEHGMLYGQRGQGSGRMPGFGDNPNTDEPDDGMFNADMLEAVAAYEASLGSRDGGSGVAPVEDDGSTTTTEEP